MRVVVIGGTGLVGSKAVSVLTARGHEAIAASRRTGIDSLTGRGLATALQGAAALVDVSNPPASGEPDAVAFFTTSTRNLLQHAAAAAVRHFVALSVVGAEALADSSYLRGKHTQESLITQSGLPYSIVRSTQFFEFIPHIADAATAHAQVRLPPVLVRPVAADDIARAVTEIALNTPVNGVVEFAGPEEFRLDDVVRQVLQARRDNRSVVASPSARYFGATVSERSLLPATTSHLGSVRFDDWLSRLTTRQPAGSPEAEERM